MFVSVGYCFSMPWFAQAGYSQQFSHQHTSLIQKASYPQQAPLIIYCMPSSKCSILNTKIPQPHTPISKQTPPSYICLALIKYLPSYIFAALAKHYVQLRMPNPHQRTAQLHMCSLIKKELPNCICPATAGTLPQWKSTLVLWNSTLKYLEPQLHHDCNN
jgi:hypothetical protein